jgi:hypothetical protein
LSLAKPCERWGVRWRVAEACGRAWHGSADPHSSLRFPFFSFHLHFIFVSFVVSFVFVFFFYPWSFYFLL